VTPERPASFGKTLRVAALKLACAVAVIWAMVHFGWLRLEVLVCVARQPLVFALAALLMLAGLLLTIVRWRALIAVQGVKLRAGEALRLGFIGFFFSCVIPGSVGGDAVKAWYVANRYGRTAEVVTSVLLDRFIGLYTFMITASLAVRFAVPRGDVPAGMAALSRAVLLLTGAMTLFFIMALSKTAKESRLLARVMARLPLHRHIEKVHESIYRYRSSKGSLAFIVLVSIMAQMPMIACHYALGSMLDNSMGFRPYFYLASVGLVVNSVPLLPGGLGTGEAAYRVLFSALGSYIGAEVAALWHVLFFAWSIIGLLLYLKGKAHYDLHGDEPQPTGISDATVH